MRILHAGFIAVLLMTGAARAQDAGEFFDMAVDALRDMGPAETRPAPPPAPVPSEPPVPRPRPGDREELAEDAPQAAQVMGPDETEDRAEPEASVEPEIEADADDDETGVDVNPPLPEARPQVAAPAAEAAAEPGDHEPEAEPDRIYQAACPAVLSGLVEAKMLPPIAADQCGLQSPLEVTAVKIADQRVPLSQPAIVNCAMAGELARWAGRINAYTEATFNAGVAGILSGTSYFCRSRNNVEGADISEHGFGNALDVTGFTLTDDTRISLPDDWGDEGAEAAAMGLAHDTACGYFTTVLGPDANALHADHLHLDLGCHGRTCTARLCE